VHREEGINIEREGMRNVSGERDSKLGLINEEELKKLKEKSLYNHHRKERVSNVIIARPKWSLCLKYKKKQCVMADFYFCKVGEF
jgi:hypothetical protein